MIMDDKLTWTSHIHELSKKLNKTIGILYRLKNLCPDSVLMSLYFSLIHSHLSYGLLIWGTARDNVTDQIFKLQKRAIRVITRSSYLAATSPLFKNKRILALPDMIEHQLACLMYDYDHNTLPTSLSELFKTVKSIHSHDTRMSRNNKLSESFLAHTKTHGDNLLKLSGPKMLNKIKDLDIFDNANCKKSFSMKYRNHLLSAY